MILEACYLAFLYAGSWIFQSIVSNPHSNRFNIPQTSSQQGKAIPAETNSHTSTAIYPSLSENTVATSASDHTQAITSDTMARQPIVKTNNTAAARKAAVKERRKAGKEALRAAREKDMASAAANAAKYEQERKKSKEVEKKAADLKKSDIKGKYGKGNKVNEDHVKVFKQHSKEAAHILAMERAEHAAYERITEGLSRKRTPSPDSQAKETLDAELEAQTKIQHNDEEPRDPGKKHIIAGENPMNAAGATTDPTGEVSSRDKVARENIANMANRVAEALATERAAAEALTKRPLFPGFPFEQSIPFDWADDVEEELSQKSDSGDESKPDEEASAVSESKSERQPSPENGTDATSPDMSIFSEDAIDKYDARVTEAVEFEEKLITPNAADHIITKNDDESVQEPAIEAEAHEQLADVKSIFTAKASQLPQIPVNNDDVLACANYEETHFTDDVPIQDTESYSPLTIQSVPKLEEVKSIDHGKFMVKLPYRLNDRSVAATFESILNESKPGPVCGINKGFDLIGAANAHEYCCSLGAPINGIGPLGRPNSDIIVASAIVPEHIDILNSAQEGHADVPHVHGKSEGSSAVTDDEDTEKTGSGEKFVEEENVETSNWFEPGDAEVSESEDHVNLEDVTTVTVVATQGDNTQDVPISADTAATSDAAIAARGAAQVFNNDDENMNEQSVNTKDDAPDTKSSVTDACLQISIETEDASDDSTPRGETPTHAVEHMYEESAMQAQERTEKETQLVSLMAELGWKIFMIGNDDEEEYMSARRRKV